MVNYYKILGLENYASVAEVKHAYKTKIKLFHPDVSTEPDAEEMTRYLNLAKEQLDTEENKTAYDRQLKLAYLIEIKRLHTGTKKPQKSYWRTLSKRDRE
ncbi:MAG: DnaJ-class molecular chaperone, partial [Bacteroidia bacterium]